MCRNRPKNSKKGESFNLNSTRYKLCEYIDIHNHTRAYMCCIPTCIAFPGNSLLTMEVMKGNTSSVIMYPNQAGTAQSMGAAPSEEGAPSNLEQVHMIPPCIHCPIVLAA